MKYSDEQIIECIRAGNERVFQFLYVEYYQMILQFIRTHGGTEDDAKDIYQDALYEFWEKVTIGSYEQKSTIKTFVFALCKYKWYNICRNKKGYSIDIDSFELESELYEPEIEQILNEQITVALDCLTKATDHCRTILESYYWKRASNKEIAQNLNLKNEDTVKTAKYKCLQKLKICVNEKLKL